MAHPQSFELPRAHDGLRVTVMLGERCIVIGGIVGTPGRREWIEELARELLPDYEIRNEVGVEPLIQVARKRLS